MKPSSWALAAAVFGAVSVTAWAQGASAPQASRGNGTVYRCPGPPILYTDSISASEAKEKNCRTIEGAPVTVMQTAKPRPVPGVRPEGSKIDPADQKARDNDRRQILESELRKEEDSLTALRKEYNNGEPERRGDERNYAKYQERVAELKASIDRKEADVAALKRELAKVQ